MFRSSGQPDTKPRVFSSQASLVLIYRPTKGMKGRQTPTFASIDRSVTFLSRWKTQMSLASLLCLFLKPCFVIQRRAADVLDVPRKMPGHWIVDGL
ncbi:hypothetical protein TNCV_3811961 [Trichonephila clavipes]|nr:hypothetical protein TNCV_3811961 [Trichonephila clavipes]